MADRFPSLEDFSEGNFLLEGTNHELRFSKPE